MSMHPKPESPITIQSLTPHGSMHAAEPPLHEQKPTPYYVAQYAMPDLPQKRPNPFITYWNKVGGGSFMLSLLIHAGIFIASYLIVDTITQDRPVDFIPFGTSKQGEEAKHQLNNLLKDKSKSKNPVSKTPPMARIASINLKDVAIPDPHIDVMDLPDMSSRFGGGTVGAPGFSDKPGPNTIPLGGTPDKFLHIPTSMINRCSTAERLQKLKENGGSDKCEKAVSDALEYLHTKQNNDGSWGTSARGAMTGFALLCYLGRCETPESAYYGDTVMKGIMYLVELQKKNPNKLFSEATTGNAPVYEHGIATYALGEMYTLARLGGRQLPGMREAFESGVKTIIDNQQKGGSWVYDQTSGTYAQDRDDLSVAGWQFQALKAAKLTSLKIDGLHGSLARVEKYFEDKQTKEGGFGATNRESHYNQWDLSGVGILGLQTMGKGKSATVKKGVKFAADLFKTETPTWDNAVLYDWYYYQQAFFQHGGEEWFLWNKQVLPILLSKQQPKGNWKSNGKGLGANSGGDDIYSTTLCTLMLEVYYRYLKVGDKEEGSIFNRGTSVRRID